MNRHDKQRPVEHVQPDGTILTTLVPWKEAWDSKEPRVTYGCAKLGPRRFIWMVTRLEHWFEKYEPEAFGYASSREEAERQLNEARRPFAGYRGNNAIGWTRRWNSELARRKRKPNNTATDAKPVEYVWYYVPPYDGDDGSWQQIPVVKKTAKRIFVRRQHVGDGEQCHVIDRQEFERTGEASTGKGWWGTYYAQPIQPERVVPDCLRVFGLNANATAEQLKRAFRNRVKAAHPDQGGSAETFRALRDSFEAALNVVR